MITELFSPRSKGSVTLASTDALDNPIVDCNYLSDPLDLLVLTEGVRYGNEIVMQGSGTKDIVKGSWPAGTLFPLALPYFVYPYGVSFTLERSFPSCFPPSSTNSQSPTPSKPPSPE